MSRTTDALADGEQGMPCLLHLVSETQYGAWRDAQSAATRRWLDQHQYQPERGRLLAIPGPDGGVGLAVAGLGQADPAQLPHFFAAGLADRLPATLWRLAEELPAAGATRFALGWLQGGYRFHQYRVPGAGGAAVRQQPAVARLVPPLHADLGEARALHRALSLARDLVNTPPNDLGPEQLEAAVAALAAAHGARLRVVRGAGLLVENYPLVHAVGQGSAREPRLIDLRWGDPGRPRVTLVGKGVCFDTGGLDLKPSAGMILMKKDMGGAAVALGLAQLLMERDAPIALRLLIPAVENSVDGRSYRPSDVVRSRRGLTVEIGNTDAEGRLILADALADADAENPELLLDFATLTGAARTALGPELPALFASHEGLGGALRATGEREQDPVWPLPLWAGYEDDLASKVADLNNVAPHGFAGAIIGALFLKRFVAHARDWAHFDLYAWNPKERPGRPVGAEAQVLRLAYRYIRERFG